MTLQEVSTGAHLALINETAAKLWGGQNPIGGKIKLDVLAHPDSPQMLLAPGADTDFTVVGVVADTRNAGLRDVTQAAVLVPYTLIAPPTRLLAVRTAGDPMLMLNTVRRKLHTLDSELPLNQAITLKEVLGFETLEPRFVMAVFSCFAGLGLILAAAGIYSVMSYDVSQRVHEIGVRVALGASRGNVLTLVLRSAYKVVSLGIVIGICGSFAVVQLIRFQLFTKTAFDLTSVLAIGVLLTLVALLAAFIPARRAGRLDPLTAMRHE
jgi:putative ABC transport system permease protein